MVQLKPSRKRAKSGSAVDVKSPCCVALGGWTWSNVNSCFLSFAAEEPDAVDVGVLPPDCDTPVDSTATVVGETAWITVFWNLAGMETRSWEVGGRIRRATWTEVVVEDGDGAMVVLAES